MSSLKPEPVRLDRAIELIAEQDAAATDAARTQRLDVVLRSSRRRAAFGLAPESLVDQLFEFTMPRLEDPWILTGARYLALLEELAQHLPDEAVLGGELRRYAERLLRSEIRRHRLLRRYLNALIGS